MSDYYYAPEYGLKGKWELKKRLLGLSFLLGKAPGASILDLGCAEGLVSREFLKNGAKSLLGLDNSNKRIEKARIICKEFSNAVFEVCDFERYSHLWYKNNFEIIKCKYDIVLYLGVHHHLPSMVQVKMIKVILKLGKYIAIRTGGKIEVIDNGNTIKK